MDYKFNIKFLKGKEMYVTEFFSRNPDNGTKSPNEIIPIAFLLKDATAEWDETKPMTRRRLRLVNAHHCRKCDDGLFVMTRNMEKTQGTKVPQMYPLKGDHNLPEVLKAGMIQTPQQVVNQQAVVEQQQPQANPAPVQQPIVVPQLQPQQQTVNVNRTVATNFLNIINHAHTYNPNPALPIAQPSF